MRFNNEKDFNKYFSENKLKGLYLLWGSEDYLISGWKATLSKPFAEEGGFNYTVMDGKELDLNGVFEVTQQLPVFAEQKMVVLDDIDTKKLIAAEMEKLEEVFAQLPDETILVATVRELDSRSTIGRKLINLADKYGAAVELSARGQQDIIKFLKSTAKSKGCSISTPLAKEMIQLCGKDMLTLENEMLKLCGYTGDGEITKQHMEAVLTPTTEERIFSLGNAIVAGNGQRAMEILRGLLYNRENPVAIVATLIMSYSDLYRGRIARDNGVPLNKALEDYNYRGREFRLRNAFSTDITTRAARESLDILYNCDRDMKSTPQDNEQLLEQTVMALLAVRRI